MESLLRGPGDPAGQPAYPDWTIHRPSMMLHPGRKPLAILLLVLHATLSLCGPGHHAGLAASAIVPLDSRRHEDPGAVGIQAAHAHCPICDYLANAVVPPDRPEPIRSLRVERASDRPDPTSLPGSPPRLSRPRAPPHQYAI